MLKKIKSEKGSITLYVIITMLFFTVFIMSIYIINSRKFATQLEANADIKAIYEKGGAEKKFNSYFASPDEEIPIYTENQLLSIGSGENIYIPQEKKIYTFVSEPEKYVIKNNITGITSSHIASLRTKLVYVKNNADYSIFGMDLLKVSD